MTAAQEITMDVRLMARPGGQPPAGSRAAPARYSRRTVVRLAVTLFGWPLLSVCRGERDEGREGGR
jgi:hypothetical protein